MEKVYEHELENWTQDQVLAANRLCDFLAEMYLKYVINVHEEDNEGGVLTQSPSLSAYVDFFIFFWYNINNNIASFRAVRRCNNEKN